MFEFLSGMTKESNFIKIKSAIAKAPELKDIALVLEFGLALSLDYTIMCSNP